MRRIYHLVPKQVWDQLGAEPYQADSLVTEGFIHCSYAEQVARSANRFYADHAELLLLDIDPALLTSPLRDESSTGGEHFPHIYGKVDRAAIVDVQPLQRDAHGQWVFPGTVG